MFGKNKFFILCIFFFSAAQATCTISPICKEHLDAAKYIIYNTIVELQLIPCRTFIEAKASCEKTGELADLATFETLTKLYTDNAGIFLVCEVDGEVVGMGAVKKLDTTRCELKRMFFAPHARGKGYDQEMMKMLIDFAKESRYQAMFLDVYNPEKQESAIKLYTNFGFKKIDPYNTNPAQLHMIKSLVSTRR